MLQQWKQKRQPTLGRSIRKLGFIATASVHHKRKHKRRLKRSWLQTGCPSKVLPRPVRSLIALLGSHTCRPPVVAGTSHHVSHSRSRSHNWMDAL